MENDSVLKNVHFSDSAADLEIINANLNKKHELFTSQLQIVINYFETVLKIKDCKEIQKYNKTIIGKSKFRRIIELLTFTATENYFLQKQYISLLFPFSENRSEVMKKLIPSECEPNLDMYKKTFGKLYEFFALLKEHTKNFVNNIFYLKNIIELKILEERIQSFLKETNYTRNLLNNFIDEGIHNIKYFSTL